MPSTVVNVPNPGTIKLTRGKTVNLGTLNAANTAVQFTIPEPTYFNAGFMLIQVGPGLVGGAFVLEISADQGASWVTFPTAASANTVNVVVFYAITGQIGGDTAAVFGAQYNVSGFGSGCLFRFGTTAFTSGSSSVWALVG